MVIEVGVVVVVGDAVSQVLASLVLMMQCLRISLTSKIKCVGVFVLPAAVAFSECCVEAWGEAVNTPPGEDFVIGQSVTKWEVRSQGCSKNDCENCSQTQFPIISHILLD